MSETESDTHSEANAAYRLGRDRFTIRMWQELAWTWDVNDEEVIESVEMSLDELLDWLDQLKDVIDPLAAIDIKQWIERYRQRWTVYCGSEEHSRDVGEGIIVPTDSLLSRNPFHHDLQDLLRITNHAELLSSGRSDLQKWFKVGSIVGRCEYLMWVGSPVADDALELLSREVDVPTEVRQESQRVRSLAPTLRLRELVRLHQSVVGLINGGAGGIDPEDYVLVIAAKPPTVYFQGNLIPTRLSPHEMRLLKAYAEHPGELLSWEDLAKLVGSSTDEKNLTRYVSRLLAKIAKASCSPDEYKDFRTRLKEDYFPTDSETGYYRLNVTSNQVLVTESLDSGD